MTSPLKRLYRLLAMLRCFSLFSSACFSVSLRSRFKKIDRETINQYLHAYAVKILRVLKAKYKITHVDQFHYLPNQPRIYMSNHASLFDTPLYYATLHDTIRTVAKKELTHLPIIGRAIKDAEHAIVDRKARGKNQYFYENAKKKLSEGVALWIFPEGTRSRDGKLLPFRLGGFRLAIETSAQIIPVGIVGTRNILPADKMLPNLHQSLEIRLGQPIDARDFATPEKLLEAVEQAIEVLIAN